MIQNTNTLHQLLITRDGSIDWEYTEQQLSRERREALRMAGKELVHNVATQSLKLAQKAGMLVVDTIDEMVQSANRPTV